LRHCFRAGAKSATVIFICGHRKKTRLAQEAAERKIQRDFFMATMIRGNF
jgi:hypothetical protein